MDFASIRTYHFAKDNSEDPGLSVTDTPTLRLVQWNIERGYQLDRIVQLLQELKPDICCLQEVDIGCLRTDGVDTVERIATALGMNAIFVPEFMELDDIELVHGQEEAGKKETGQEDARKKAARKRSPRDAGGNGLHGNAILSRWKIHEYRMLTHRYQPFHWERDGHTKGEPRKGRYVISIIMCRRATGLTLTGDELLLP